MEVADGLSQLVGDSQRVIRRAVLEEHAELVASQAGERIALAQALEQHGADLAHELVAGGVTAGVVDDLELVQIEIHHRVVAAQFRGALEREPQATLEFGAIYQAGQGVVTRLVGKLGDILALAADIVHDQDHADDLARPRPYRGGGLYDRNFRTVVAHQQHGGRNRDGALLAQDHFDRVGRDLARGFVDGIDDAPQRQSPRRSRGPAGQCLRHRIEVFDPTVGVGRDHAVGDGREGDLSALFLGKQLRCSQPAVGRVGHSSGHAHRPSRGGAQRLTAEVEPAVFPGLGLQPHFDVERTAALQVSVDGLLVGRLVLRMQARIERLHVVAHFPLCVAQELPEARRVVDLAGIDVPVPEPVVAARHRKIEPLLAQLERPLGLLSAPDHPVREVDAHGDQGARDCEVREQKEEPGLAGRFAQGA